MKVGKIKDLDGVVVDEFGNSWYWELRLPRVSDLISGSLSDKKVSIDSFALQKGNIGHDFCFGDDVEEFFLEGFYDTKEIENLKFFKNQIQSLLSDGWEIYCQDKEEDRFYALTDDFIYSGLRDCGLIKGKQIKFFDLKTGAWYEKYNIQSLLYTLPEAEDFEVDFDFFMSKTGEFIKGRVFKGEFDEVKKLYNNLFAKKIEDLSPIEKYLDLKEQLVIAKKEMEEFLNSQNSKKIENNNFTAVFKEGYSFISKPKQGGDFVEVKGSWTVKKI